MDDATLQNKVEKFLFTEARLLDSGDFSAWLELYAPDGIYWMPSQPGQTDAKTVASIIYEDHPILSIRVQRLFEARALVLTPMPETVHMLSNIEVEDAGEDGLVRAEATFICIQYQANEQKIFSGRQRFDLLPEGDSFRIRLKRVDLLNAGGTLPLITIPF
ncbi:aromatic-ring-hydroxylating dioxygenase subunit beta [Pseudodonghicola flavimaris]|uniref:Aromatic-ring-hydroxylating dioxygenase subunit beta n=1 Tax=Pseudodonghicola flavimaris TaxID=3050036 RepID=A0ABT7F0K9_9RHOB|nr:aromatic-ring-hydroxylating dioxygenase subunit beta [Pseudodonghicola flavimaris]MDK3018029.1 aromatic-ring-hydroxylating dioxygenase subunit beta [Pseudodonghicola flavimaris]